MQGEWEKSRELTEDEMWGVAEGTVLPDCDCGQCWDYHLEWIDEQQDAEAEAVREMEAAWRAAEEATRRTRRVYDDTTKSRLW